MHLLITNTSIYLTYTDQYQYLSTFYLASQPQYYVFNYLIFYIDLGMCQLNSQIKRCPSSIYWLHKNVKPIHLVGRLNQLKFDPGVANCQVLHLSPISATDTGGKQQRIERQRGRRKVCIICSLYYIQQISNSYTEKEYIYFILPIYSAAKNVFAIKLKPSDTLRSILPC